MVSARRECSNNLVSIKKSHVTDAMKDIRRTSKNTNVNPFKYSTFIGLYCSVIFCCLGPNLLVPVSAQIAETTESTVVEATEEATQREISYVLEPYENTATSSSLRPRSLFNFRQVDLETDGLFDLSITSDDALFGEYALQVDYSNDYAATAAVGSDNVARFGWITSESHRRYSCAGATHISFWYKMLPPSTEEAGGGSNVDFNLRFVLLDSSDVDCVNNAGCASNPDLFENYYSSYYILQSPEDQSSSHWKEIRIPLDSDNFMLDMGNGRGQIGNEMLDLQSVKGWYYEISPVAKDGDTAGAPDTESTTTVLIDQLACVGGGDLFGSSFQIGLDETFDDAVSHDLWEPEYYQSDLSETETTTTLQGGVLSSNFTIEQSQTWGGFVSYQHLALDESYFNLSQASSVWLNYQVNEAASPSSRAHLRIMLLDSSGCTEDCGVVGNNNMEVYYSFHNILDEGGSGIMKVPLVGTSDASSPFWRTG